MAAQLESRRSDEPGWRVIRDAVAHSHVHLGSRLVAGFALGSLAHGGFSAATSDIDLALILDAVTPDPAAALARIRQHVEIQNKSPLAARLSIFWSSWHELAQPGPQGRFPLVDRIDLQEHGRWLFGTDRRTEILLPDGVARRHALVLESAEFMLQKLATPAYTALLHNPDLLARQGVRDVTKAILFPARFLATLATGRADGNEPAVRDFAAAVGAPLSAFASQALQWRKLGSLPDIAEVCAQCREHLLPLYRELVDQYMLALRQSNSHALIESLYSWRIKL